MSPAQFRLREVFCKYTRGPIYSEEKRFQSDLLALDKDLILRFNFLYRHWSIYYDHNGIISVLKTVKSGECWPCQTFRKVYQWLKYESQMTIKKLMEAHKTDTERYEAEQQAKIDEAGEEGGKTLHRCLKARVTDDGMTPKK